MITYLKVRNLAIVEEFAIEPGAGLNVLTGETGAGKSLLIDSLELLRGARGSSDMIRAGTDKMSAEAVFSLPKHLGAQLDALGIELDAPGDEL
ncbi:MAG TPA: AAA family ATPase, partial [Thermoanaerobaculia bacterium]